MWPSGGDCETTTANPPLALRIAPAFASGRAAACPEYIEGSAAACLGQWISMCEGSRRKVVAKMPGQYSYCIGNASLGADSLTQPFSALFDICAIGGKFYRFRQRLRREFLAGHRPRAYTQFCHPPSPERLIAKEWDDDRRYSRSQSRRCSSCPTVMHHSRHPREKPLMGSKIYS